MGKCRLYRANSDDARVLDRILKDNLQGDVRLGTDRIIVSAGDDDLPSGCLVWRPSAFIHEFHVPNCLAQRAVADRLFSEAVKLDFNRRHLIRQAVWMVDSDNLPMLRYAREVVHATEQKGTIFLLNLKAPGDTQ